MSTFIGKTDARLDDKGRIFIPAAYRKILAEYDSRKVIMRREPGNECLVFYPEEVWNEKVDQLKRTLNDWDYNDQMILMQFVADAQPMELDAQGRVLIQKRDLEQISAEGDVVFIGMLDKFALWSPQRFEQRCMPQQEFSDILRNKMKNQ